MYPELAQEFNPDEYKETFEFQMELVNHTEKEFEYSIDLPYGDIEVDLRWAQVQKGEINFAPIGDAEQPGVSITHDPEPVSEQHQKKLNEIEAEENKQREKEARMTQKKLDDQKEQEILEKQHQIFQ